MWRKFAWWPVQISEYRHPYWHRTGKRAWLRYVIAGVTVWGDVYYTEPGNASD